MALRHRFAWLTAALLPLLAPGIGLAQGPSGFDGLWRGRLAWAQVPADAATLCRPMEIQIEVIAGRAQAANTRADGTALVLRVTGDLFADSPPDLTLQFVNARGESVLTVAAGGWRTGQSWSGTAQAETPRCDGWLELSRVEARHASPATVAAQRAKDEEARRVQEESARIERARLEQQVRAQMEADRAQRARETAQQPTALSAPRPSPLTSSTPAQSAREAQEARWLAEERAAQEMSRAKRAESSRSQEQQMRAQQEAERAARARTLALEEEKRAKDAQLTARMGSARRESPAPPAAQPSPGAAETTTVARYPTLEAPDTTGVGRRIAVQFWLTEDPITPEVQVKTGDAATLTADGQIAMRLPAQQEWRLRAVLTAPGFDLVEGEKSQEIKLTPKGDSTPALFTLVASAKGDLPRKEKLRVTLWHDGAFIATVAREIAITAGAGATVAAAAPPATKTQREAAPSVATAQAQPDLTMHLVYDDPGKLGGGQIILASPHFQPPSRLVVERFSTPPDTQDWLFARYGEMLILAEEINTAAGGDEKSRHAAMRARVAPLLAGLGRELYRRFAPAPFKDVLSELRGLAPVKLRSIQIYTNNPLLPWELMRPDQADGTAGEHLAVAYRVARWHVGDDRRLFDRPPQHLQMRELAAMAPRYSGAAQLPAQEEEIAALRSFPGYRPVEGRLDALRRLMAEPPSGIVHFMGHGLVEVTAGRAPTYLIGLEDAKLDLTSWRGLSEGRKRHHPLYFFNACEVGRADSVANFVDGWAPAVLESGAAGYVGGLWPLFDRAAADFSRLFYARLNDGLASGPVAVADALSAARRRFHETGDPTYLAYAYYGDVNLMVTR